MTFGVETVGVVVHGVQKHTIKLFKHLASNLIKESGLGDFLNVSKCLFIYFCFVHCCCFLNKLFTVMKNFFSDFYFFSKFIVLTYMHLVYFIALEEKKISDNYYKSLLITHGLRLVLKQTYIKKKIELATY